MRWALVALLVLPACSSGSDCSVPKGGFHETTVVLDASTGDVVRRDTTAVARQVGSTTTSTSLVVSVPGLHVEHWSTTADGVAVVGRVGKAWFAVLLDPATGAARWTRKLPWPAERIVAGDGRLATVLSGSFGKDIVLALDPVTGRIGWEHSLDLPGHPSLALGPDQVVVTATDAADCS